MTYKVSDDGNNVWIETKNTPFSTKKLYKVAMNSYMASTVDVKAKDEGRSMFKTSEEMIIEYLKKHKEIDYQGVSRTK